MVRASDEVESARTPDFCEKGPPYKNPLRRLNLGVVYVISFVCFAGFLVVANLRHWDWIPGHVTPFYAVLDVRPPNLFFLFPVAFAALFIALLRLVLDGTVRVRTGYLLCLLIICGTALHLLVAMMDGGAGAISAPYRRWGYEYYGDVPFVRNPVQFMRDYADLMPHLSMHARVHPPGPVLMLWLISLFTGYSPLGVSIGSVALSNLAIVPLYFFSKQLFGHRVALHSVLLYLFAPAVVLFTCTCADTLFTLFTASSLCFFVVAMERRSRLSAALAGLSFALATLMSFNLAILGAFFAVVGVTYLADREDRPDAVRCLSLMAGVFLAFYALAFVVARFDVVECFLKASRQVKTDLTNQDLYTPRAPFITWRFGTPIAVLCFAGIPATGLFALWVVRGPSANNSAPMARNSAAYYVGSLATLAVFDLLCFGKGEGERIWVFLLPLIIVPAAAMIARGTSKPSTVLVWTLGLTFLQTMVMEAVLFTYW